jgi:ParB-like chromosome segregation protein Spo0J
VATLIAAGTPRLHGEDTDHIQVLAGIDGPLPPIVVHRRSMRVLDGMHRLRAAIIRGDQYIDVRFFDGDEDEAFIVAVQANIAHGLPLSLTDRRSAALRILTSHPTRSDRAIASVVGLSHKTVGALRRTAVGEIPQLDARVGRDGRERPTNIDEARDRARALLEQDPKISLRQAARATGISPETVRDIRRQIATEDTPPSPAKGPTGQVSGVRPADRPGSPTRTAERSAASTDRPGEMIELLDRLNQDPALRLNQVGRFLLRLLAVTTHAPEHWHRLAHQVPAHRQQQVATAARACARAWSDFAERLEVPAHDALPLERRAPLDSFDGATEVPG